MAKLRAFLALLTILIVSACSGNRQVREERDKDGVAEIRQTGESTYTYTTLFSYTASDGVSHNYVVSVDDSRWSRTDSKLVRDDTSGVITLLHKSNVLGQFEVRTKTYRNKNGNPVEEYSPAR